MKLDFTPQEIARLNRLRGLAVEHREVAAELELAAKQIPVVAKAEIAARDSLPAFRPSVLLAMGEMVRAIRQAHEDAAFLSSALRSSEHQLKSRFASLSGEVNRDFKELQDVLRWKVKAAFLVPGRNDAKLNTNSGIISPECSAAINRVVIIEGDNIADRAEALLALAVEHGLQIPEEAS